MFLSIDRGSDQRQESSGRMLFQARDRARRTITVAMSLSAWATVQQEAGADPIAELEYLARRGHWEPHEGKKVWQLDLL